MDILTQVQKLVDMNVAALDYSHTKLIKETRGEMMKALHNLAHEIDSMTDKDSKACLKAQLNFEKLKDQVRDIDKWSDESSNPDISNNARNAPEEGYQFPDSGTHSLENNNPNVQIWESVSGQNKGKEIKVLNNRASLVKELGYRPEEGMNWSNYLRGRIAGFTADKSLQGPKNIMSTSSDSAMVPTPLSTQVIDLARNKSRIFQAGAQTFEMLSKTETIARVTGDASPSWKAENASHSASDVSTEPLTFTAKTLVASVKMSVELSEDAPNGSNVIENSLSESLALELDRAALVGSGSGAEPQGIHGYTDVQTSSLGAALTSYDPLSEAVQKVLEKNGTPTGIIYAPRTWGELDRLKDSQNQPLLAPASYQDLAKFQTNQVPINLGTGENESLAFVGDWMSLLVGVRTGLRLEVTRVASDETNSAWEDLQVWVRAYLRVDMQLAQPGHFCVIEAIEPPA